MLYLFGMHLYVKNSHMKTDLWLLIFGRANTRTKQIPPNDQKPIQKSTYKKAHSSIWSWWTTTAHWKKGTKFRLFANDVLNKWHEAKKPIWIQICNTYSRRLLCSFDNELQQKESHSFGCIKSYDKKNNKCERTNKKIHSLKMGIKSSQKRNGRKTDQKMKIKELCWTVRLSQRKKKIGPKEGNNPENASQ